MKYLYANIIVSIFCATKALAIPLVSLPNGGLEHAVSSSSAETGSGLPTLYKRQDDSSESDSDLDLPLKLHVPAYDVSLKELKKCIGEVEEVKKIWNGMLITQPDPKKLTTSERERQAEWQKAFRDFKTSWNTFDSLISKLPASYQEVKLDQEGWGDKFPNPGSRGLVAVEEWENAIFWITGARDSPTLRNSGEYLKKSVSKHPGRKQLFKDLETRLEKFDEEGTINECRHQILSTYNKLGNALGYRYNWWA